jgi:hypothetical protein
MTDRELPERLDKNYAPRKRRLADALQGGARRADRPIRSEGGLCAICHRKEHGGGLVPYELRDGHELLVGHRCAEYLDYLASHPEYADQYSK